MADSLRLGQIFLAFKIMQSCIKDPRFPDELKRKYPKHIMPLGGPMNKMVDRGLFYFWTVEKPTGKMAIFLVLIVVLVMAFMLFNLWPLWLKIGLWYFSFYLLMILVLIIIIPNFCTIDRYHCRKVGCIYIFLALWYRLMDYAKFLRWQCKNHTN